MGSEMCIRDRSIVVKSNQKISSIENPDDNLESLLNYLIKEGQ